MLFDCVMQLRDEVLQKDRKNIASILIFNSETTTKHGCLDFLILLLTLLKRKINIIIV